MPSRKVIPIFCWPDCRIQEILWRLNPSWGHLQACLLLLLKISLLMRRKGSCHVDLIVKTIIHFIDSDHIPSIILFITFPRIWIIRIFCVSSAHCSQLTGIMRRSKLSDCLCQLIGLLRLTLWVFAQLGAHRSKGLLQNFCLLQNYKKLPYCFQWYLWLQEN